MAKKSSNTGARRKASDPVTDEPGKENAPATSKRSKKPKAYRVYRGIKCEIERSTRNTKSGVIYDRILFPRQVTNNHDKSVQTVYIGLKVRRTDGEDKQTRPGKEVEVEI